MKGRGVCVVVCLLLAVFLVSVSCADEKEEKKNYSHLSYENWVTEVGVKAPNVEEGEFSGYGRGMSATKDLKDGDLVASVPVSLFLTSRKARDVAFAGLVKEIEGVSDHLLLSLLLLAEKYNPKSDWAPWIAHLPTKFSSTMYWSEKEMEELKGSFLHSATVAQKEQLKKNFEVLEPYLTKNYAELFPEGKLTESDFIWASNIVSSKSFTLTLSDGNVIALIPFLDTFNHGEVETHFKYDENTSSFQVFTNTSFEAGEQVFLYTGKKTNLDLLLSNGYVIEDKKMDVVYISTRMTTDDEFYEIKRRLLAMNNFMENGLYTMDESGPSAELYQSLRIQLAKEKDLIQIAKVSDKEDYGPVSLDNELSVMRTILAACEKMLKDYPTTLEEDEQKLKASLSMNKRNAIVVRKGEKRVIQEVVQKVVSDWKDYLVNDFPLNRVEEKDRKENVELSSEKKSEETNKREEL